MQVLPSMSHKGTKSSSKRCKTTTKRWKTTVEWFVVILCLNVLLLCRRGQGPTCLCSGSQLNYNQRERNIYYQPLNKMNRQYRVADYLDTVRDQKLKKTLLIDSFSSSRLVSTDKLGNPKKNHFLLHCSLCKDKIPKPFTKTEIPRILLTLRHKREKYCIGSRKISQSTSSPLHSTADYHVIICNQLYLF